MGNWVDDGDCDDGGPGWEYTLCELGNDCTDCGARLCIDDCNWVTDGDCDDGGPGWEYTLCDLGTDCTDCGARAAALLQVPPSTKSRKKEKQEEDKKRKKTAKPMQKSSALLQTKSRNLCIDDCNWVNDGDCDDGGPGWEYTLCELGTDCTDCGARAAALLQMPPATKS